MTFTLDHPHGYKLAGFPESEARIVARDGRKPNRPLVVEWRSGPTSGWGVNYWQEDGASETLPSLINAPAPKRKVYVAMVRVNDQVKATWWEPGVSLGENAYRISPVVEVEIDV